MCKADEQNLKSRSDIDVVMIIVNYRSASATSELIADVLQQDQATCKVSTIVADNGPINFELDAVRAKYRCQSSVHFETMPKNLGYFGAANHVLGNLCKNHQPEWVIVSNADIRLPQKDVFLRIAALTSRCAVIAPRIVSKQVGLDQNPFQRKRPSAFRMYLNRIIPRFRVLYRLREVQYEARRTIRGLWAWRSRPAVRSEVIYAPHGAFIIFGKEYFQRGGSLDVGAFLFAEEGFVAETCRKLGLDVRYDPTIEVVHDEHISTRHNPAIRGFHASAADYIYGEFFAQGKNQSASELT
jgi:GT2 family glycosyltransferase